MTRQVDELLENLMRRGIGVDKLRSLWQQYTDLTGEHDFICDIWSLRNDVDRLSRALVSVRRTGRTDLGTAAQIAAELRAAKEKYTLAAARKAELVERQEEARTEAVRETRKVLQGFIACCAEEVLEVVSTHSRLYGGVIPELFPERVRELWQEANWALGMLCYEGILQGFRRQRDDPLNPFNMFYFMPEYLRDPVRLACGLPVLQAPPPTSSIKAIMGDRH